MQLVLRDSVAKIRTTYLDSDGAAVVPTNPAVTITRDLDSATITADTVTVEGGGVVSATFDAPATVDRLTAVWTADDASAPDSEVGVVGGFLCTLEEIAAAVEGDPPSTLALRRAREAAEEQIEHACHVAFRPTFASETFDGLFGRPRMIEVLTVDGEVASEPRVGSTVTYSHGWPVPPEPIRRAAVILAVSYADSAGGDRISRFSEDGQEFFLTLPGGGQNTGIPEVDQAIAEYRQPVVA